MSIGNLKTEADLNRFIEEKLANGAGLMAVQGVRGLADQLEEVQNGAQSVPTGLIGTWHTGVTAPAGWLDADGSDVSRTTYAALFAVLATIYGPGDGSTTFTLPTVTDSIVKT